MTDDQKTLLGYLTLPWSFYQSPSPTPPSLHLSPTNRSLKDNLSHDLGFPAGSTEAQLRSWNQLDGLLHVWGGALLR